MKLTLQQIHEASRCFRYFRYALSDPPKSLLSNASVVQRTMQKSYTRALETNFRPTWRAIVNWIDKEVFKDVDVQEQEAWDQAKSRAEALLMFTNRWYREILMEEELVAYSNVTLTSEIHGVSVTTVAPIVKLEEHPVVLEVGSIAQTDWQLYNNIKIRGMAAMVSKALDCDVVGYQRLSIGPKGGFTNQKIFVDQEGHKGAKKMMLQIVRSIQSGIDFQSVSEQCNVCPFKRRCSI